MPSAWEFWAWAFVWVFRNLLKALERLRPVAIIALGLNVVPQLVKETGFTRYLDLFWGACCVSFGILELVNVRLERERKKLEKLEEELHRLKYGPYLGR